MSPDFDLPADPLDRFCKVFRLLNEERSWYEDATALRYSALTLASMPGDPGRIARGLQSLAEELKDLAGWFGTLRSQIRFAAHVVNRVEDRHRIKLPIQPQRAHVAIQVCKLGIQLARQLQHSLCDIRSRDLEVPLQIAVVVSCSATEVQQGPHRNPRMLAHHLGECVTFVRIVSRRTDQSKHPREVFVEACHHGLLE